MQFVALVVLLITVVVPAIELGCLCALFLGLRTRSPFRFRGVLLRVRQRLLPWSMVEIFVLGAVVAIVKLGDFAHISLGIGMWSLAAFIVLSAAARLAFEHTDFWGSRA